MSDQPYSRLHDIVARLRGPDGCPWDKAQDLSSMRPYLLEETYEALDALDRLEHTGRGGHLVAEELGDLLFVVLMLARIGDEAGTFDALDVPRDIADKMVVRHPHVFDPDSDAPAHVTDAESGLAAWESIKARDAKKKARRASRLDGVPRALPSLLRAHRQGEKAAAAGFDWPDYRGVLVKVREELGELEAAIAEAEAAGQQPGTPRGERADPTLNPRTPAPTAVVHELGDVLLSVAELGRHLGASPEEALRTANDRFRDRFAIVEQLAAQRSLPLPGTDDDVLDALWEEAKRRIAVGELAPSRRDPTATDDTPPLGGAPSVQR